MNYALSKNEYYHKSYSLVQIFNFFLQKATFFRPF